MRIERVIENISCTSAAHIHSIGCRLDQYAERMLETNLGREIEEVATRCQVENLVVLVAIIIQEIRYNIREVCMTSVGPEPPDPDLTWEEREDWWKTIDRWHDSLNLERICQIAVEMPWDIPWHTPPVELVEDVSTALRI